MFLSSHGGLTAGRRDAEHALFPYLTDDKIRDQAEVTGGKTLLRVGRGGAAKNMGTSLRKRGRAFPSPAQLGQERLGTSGSF